MILARERVLVLGLIAMPALEIGVVAGEGALDSCRLFGSITNPRNVRLFSSMKRLELRDRQPVLLHMEAEIAQPLMLKKSGELHSRPTWG